MDHKQEPDSDLVEAMRLAQTPAGKQLIDLLQNNHSEQLQNALQLVSDGDYSQAKDAINAFLSTPDAKALLEQFGGNS